MPKGKKMKPVKGWMVSNLDRSRLHISGGTTKRRAIKCFMDTYAPKSGTGSKWRYWHYYGYRAIRVEIREVTSK